MTERLPAGLVWSATAALAFLVGSVNPATIVARVLQRDLSRAGSGNPGATNAGRVLGLRWGVVVAVLDVLKGLLPTYLALRTLGEAPAYLVGIAAVLGHVFSPFLRGRGGKGVATALGAVAGVHPWYALAVVLVFVLVLAMGRWVAGASLAGAATLVVLGVLAGLGLLAGGWPAAAWSLSLAAVVGARHHANVRAWRRARGMPPSQRP